MSDRNGMSKISSKYNWFWTHFFLASYESRSEVYTSKLMEGLSDRRAALD